MVELADFIATTATEMIIVAELTYFRALNVSFPHLRRRRWHVSVDTLSIFVHRYKVQQLDVHIRKVLGVKF
jgi:hypothetical protein